MVVAALLGPHLLGYGIGFPNLFPLSLSKSVGLLGGIELKQLTATLSFIESRISFQFRPIIGVGRETIAAREQGRVCKVATVSLG